MKQIILLVQLLTFTFIVNAQENRIFQLNDRTIEFTVSQDEIYVEFESSKKAYVQKQAKEGYEELTENSAILKVKDLSNSYIQRKILLQNIFTPSFKRIEPVLIYKDGTKQIAKGELNIKLENNYSISDILDGYQFEFQNNEFKSDMYLVKLNLETSELFDLVNQLQTDKRVKFAEPNFIRISKPHTIDPLFPAQWSINNIAAFGGIEGADMDVDLAWANATGSNIKVAIIDDGVDLGHEDLNANLLPGYDATNFNFHGAPSFINNDSHGTACAGVVAAVANNNKGIAGVAYNAKIIPIRVGYSASPNTVNWINEDSWVANGINWAWQNGADVLSNSYGGGSYSQTIVDAINDAVNYGRNNKGSIVLFSSGNDNGGNGNEVSFPGYVNNAIAVGASSMCDERVSLTSCDGENWGSNYGSALDVVAPGVKIYTTDISGANGYTNGDYRTDFRGTSAACPNAAGVAALVLSVNPNFTQTQVREILETTTDKIGSTPYNVTFQNYGATQTWNNEVGYGRLNANSAVQKALNYDNYNSHYITGPTQITPGTGGMYKVSNPYVYATHYVWSIPSGCYNGYCWEIVQGQGTHNTLIHGGSLGVQDITCKIYNGSTLIGQQRITVNVQNPYNGGGSGDPCGGLQTGPNVIYPPIPCDDNGPNSVNQNNFFKKVYIYSVSGQVVLQLEDTESVDLSQLSSGLYFVKAELSNNTILTKKIVKK